MNNDFMGEVYPGLWVGSLAAISQISSGTEVLQEQDASISILPPVQWTVISLVYSERLLRFAKNQIEQQASDTLIRKHVVWRIEDKNLADFLSPQLSRMLEELDYALDTPDGIKGGETKACLVHCAKGVSRSVSLCVAWLMSRRKVASLEEALDCLRQARPQAQPNLGFLACLRAIEQCQGNLEQARARIHHDRIEI